MATAKTEMPTTAELNSALTRVNKKLTLGFWVTHGSYCAFIVLMSWLNFQQIHIPAMDVQAVDIQPIGSNIKLWLVKIIPLLIFIPGFIKRKYRTYSWLCFAILPYFIWVTPLVMGRGSCSDWMLISLIVILFISAMMTSRWMQQQSYLGWQISQTPSI